MRIFKYIIMNVFVHQCGGSIMGEIISYGYSGRTYGAIESNLDYLGLKKKPLWLFGRKHV